MDPQSLLDLLSESTHRLASLYTELGHPPERLDEAVSTLHKTLHAALEGQMDTVQREVDDAREKIATANATIERLLGALGEVDVEVPGRRISRSKNKSIKGEQYDESEVSKRSRYERPCSLCLLTKSIHINALLQPLLPRVESLTSEVSRLQNLYNSRRSQADKLSAQLDMSILR